jgi:hypothetical protein
VIQATTSQRVHIREGAGKGEGKGKEGEGEGRERGEGEGGKGGERKGMGSLFLDTGTLR